MKIKSILLCSTATLLLGAASANAATVSVEVPHVVKPIDSKPVIQVQKVTPGKVVITLPKQKKHIIGVCSAYGSDYINMPGTQTCIKIYGQVSMDAIGGASLNPVFSLAYQSKDKNHLGIETEGRIGFETMTPSRLGNIHTLIEARGHLGSGLGYYDASKGHVGHHEDALDARLKYAYADIGGLHFGLDTTAFSNFARNFGEVQNDDLLIRLEETAAVHTISYTFAQNNGMSYLIGLEAYNRDPLGANGFYNKSGDKKIDDNRSIDTANLVIGAKYNQGWGDIIATAAYEGFYKSLSARIRADYNVNDRTTIFALASFKNLKDTYELSDAKGATKDINVANAAGFVRNSNRSLYSDWDGTWEAMIGGSYKINSYATFNGQLGYTQARTLGLSADVSFELAKGFTVVPEITYLKWNDNHSIYDVASKKTFKNVLDGDHQTQAMVHLCYKF